MYLHTQGRDALGLGDDPPGAGWWKLDNFDHVHAVKTPAGEVMEWKGMGWEWKRIGWDGMGWNGMGWDGMEWGGIKWDGMDWNGIK